MVRKLLITLGLLALTLTATAQVSGVRPLSITSVTSGNTVGRWTEAYDGEEPIGENFVYADVTVSNVWQIGDAFAPLDGVRIIHTKDADKGSTAATTVQFTTDLISQICVWHADSITTKGGWLATGGYTDSGHDITLPGGFIASGFCTTKAAGVITLGGNTTDGATTSPMYVVSVAPVHRIVPPVNVPPPDENGFIVFASAAGAMDESTTDATLIQFRRILGSDGAVSVDVGDAGTGTCTSGVEYNALPGTTFNWADGVLGDQFLSITANAAAATCTVVLDFSTLTGGIAPYTERQTMTVTINDVAATPVGSIFISDIGNDTSDCSSGTPCLTLQHAHDIASPNDVIEMIFDGGGIWTYTQCTTFTNSGTAGNPIRVFANASTTVRFRPSSACTAILDFDGAAYWHIDGSVGSMTFGNESQWSQSNAGQGYTHKLSIFGHNSANNIEIDSIQSYGGGLFQGECNLLDQSTDYFYIHDSTFELCGTNDEIVAGGNFGLDRGDLISVAGENHLIENSTFRFGGHVTLELYAHDSVLRGNTFDGDWTAKGTPSPGSSAGSMTPGANLNRGIAPYGPNLLERNIFINAGDSGDQTNQTISKLYGYRIIFRQNLACDNDGVGYKTGGNNNGGFSVGHTSESLRFYHNTTINSGAWMALDSGRPNGLDNMSDNRFLNNLHDNGTVQTTFGWTIMWENNVSNQQGYPDDWMGAIFKNNWIHTNDYDVRFRAPLDESMDWFTDLESQYPNVFSQNAKTRASFVNPSLCTFAGLKLNGVSAGLDAAVPMGVITGASSGTSVTMDDAWWIYDGFNLSTLGELGDQLAFYDSTGTTLRGIRRATSVNSSTSVTVSSAITLSVGDIVFLYDEVALRAARDMGASQ